MTLPATVSPATQEQSFSDVLLSLGRGDNPRLSLREMVEAFGERAFGALLLLLTLLALFPWPPGGKAVFSIPIIMLAAEMALQQSKVWLPKALLDRNVSRQTYQKLINSPVALPRWVRRRVMPTGKKGISGWFKRRIAVTPSNHTPLSLVRAAEKLTRPRWTVLTGPISDTLIGIACIALAVMMALPVPFGDMLPGIAIALLSLGVIQKDGVFVVAGAIATALSGIYMMLVWKTVLAIIVGTIGWITSLF